MTSYITRVVTLACALAAGGFCHAGAPSTSEAEGPLFANPPEIRSHNGHLQATLEAKDGFVTIDGKQVPIIGYNGLYTPPTLRLKPGDVADIRLINHCNRPTNIHFHGLRVSPQASADNMMVKVSPGQEFTYHFQIPKDHATGLYWYHSHAPADGEPQVMRGLSGALVIEGLLEDSYPQLQHVKQQIINLKDLQINIFGRVPQVITPALTTVRTVNGKVNPRMTIRPGETQLWSLSDQCADLFFMLRLDGLTFYIVAEDGHPTNRMIPVQEYVLGPSSRVEFLVHCDQPGVHTLATSSVRTGPAGDGYGAQTLATLVCEGPPAGDKALPIEPGCCAPHQEDLRQHKVDAKRLFVFSDGAEDFRINDRTFDMNRVDTRVPLGNVEEWTLRNSSDELHHFHLHQLPFQVVTIDGKPAPFTGYRDTIPIPNRGSVKIRISFTDPRIVGTFMYHCHIMEHEDGGMMGVIQVYDPARPDGGIVPMETHPLADTSATGGPIKLTNSSNQTWSLGSAGERLDLVTFGYTQCENACPRTLKKMQSALANLGKAGAQVQPVFVSIDPAKDRPEVLAQYEKNAGFRLRALTGSEKQVGSVATQYGVTVRRESGRISHTTDTFLVTPQGRILARYPLNTSAAELTAGIRKALAQTANSSVADVR